MKRFFPFAFPMFLIAYLYWPANALFAQMPAFPGAEGVGKFTTGGRGTASMPTTVFEVTNLNDDGNPGSLRYALTQTAAYRTVVFQISGTIHLNSKLNIPANTTVAGQTAPGDGICLADYPVVISGNNVIVRYLRFRMGDKNQNKGMVDGAGSDDAFGNAGNKNIIIDHCTASWSTDEAMSIYRGDSVTIQWCLLSEPLNYSYHFETGDTDFEQHGYGGIWGGRHASFHHNLIVHCKGRCPRFDGSRNLSPGTAGQENADFRNNVIYNWGSYNVNGGEGGNYNLVSNYYKYGPSTSNGSSAGVPVRYQIMNPYATSPLPYPKLFVDGNYVDGNPTITQDNWKGIAMNGGSLADTNQSKVSTPFALVEVPIQSATDAYELVLNYTGVSLPNRDTLDQRIVNDVRNRTGRIIDVQGGYAHGTPYSQTVTAWPALNSTAAPADSDHDGMPDNWETTNGLNPNNASDRNGLAANGYTHLENYLNSRAANAFITTANFNTFSQNVGTASAVQTFTFTGKNLTGAVTIKPPLGYEVSNDGNNWFDNSHPLVLAAVNGGIANTVISVRLNAASAATFNGPLQMISNVGAVVQLPLQGSASSVTAINEVAANEGFYLSPNPAHSYITIKHKPLLHETSFILYNQAGENIRTCKGIQGSDHTKISTDHLPAGSYFIQLRTNNKTIVMNFVKLN